MSASGRGDLHRQRRLLGRERVRLPPLRGVVEPPLVEQLVGVVSEPVQLLLRRLDLLVGVTACAPSGRYIVIDATAKAGRLDAEEAARSTSSVTRS